MDNSTKHHAISRELATEILAGKYSQTGRLPSEIQLLKRFEVSRPTIGRALRSLQEQGLVERRAGSGTYVRLDHGGSAKSEVVSKQMGMIIPSQPGILESICGELARLARVNDFGLWSSVSGLHAADANMTVDEAEDLCTRFIEGGVSGVFFVPFEHRLHREESNRRITERLSQAGIPVVLIDRDIGEFPTRSEFDIVGVDNFAGGYLLAQHLIKLGARRLAYVTRPLTASTVDARIAGARIAMINNGLETPHPFVYAGDPADTKFVRSFAQSRQLDGIMCTSDHVAAELLQSLNRLGVSVPNELRVVGFDNVRFASLLTVPLTTMEQPCRDIALTAFTALRERMANSSLPPRNIIMTPRMIVRESCGAYLRQG